MRNAAADLERFLDELARDARAGDRLPTIRELMQRFGASQLVVQRAFDGLKARGLIAPQVGRGTFFRGGSGGTAPARAAVPATEAAPRRPAERSVLLLRRSVSITRGRVAMELLQRRFAADGHRVIELSYTDPEHATEALRGMPRFDACVVQSTFRTIPVALLAALREKCDVLAVDGLALLGTDVESVGVEWGAPLARAVDRLRARGHRRVVFATTSLPLAATQFGRRRFEELAAACDDGELRLVTVPQLPDGDMEAGLVEAIRADRLAGGACTAAVVWGVERGAEFRRRLADAGLAVPQALSVVLLGRSDLVNEHDDFFEIVGCRVADQAEALYAAIVARWADPSLPFGVRLIPVSARDGASVAAAGSAEGAAAGQPRRRTRATVSSASATDSPT